MRLRHFFTRLNEGGNAEVDGHQAQQIDLKVHNRGYIVPILSTLLDAINAGFQQSAGGPLWSPKVLKARKYLSGSSLHFFNTDLPDDEFERVKPKVGDIDTQVNKASEPQLAQWLDSVKGQVVGNARFLGYGRGNEQYSSLWELTDPPIKVQIDFEFVDYSEKEEPTDWAAFSHSSNWDDISQGIKGVFHKFLIQSLSKISAEEFILRKVHKKTGKITDKVEKDSMLSFAVSSKEGGGLRTKYEPVLDEKGRPLEIDGLPVLRELPPGNYEKDISKIFQAIFDKRIDRATLSKALTKTWSFTGLLELINLILSQEEKESVLDSFVDKLFARGAQGLYKGDAQRDLVEKNVALNYALKTLGVTPPTNLEQMRQEYVKNYRVATEGPVGLDNPIDEAEGDAAPVKAQLRKGMPHLHDLRPLDFLDLLDELHDGNGSFKLENIPLNVKVDGFGGRFGKNSEGKPFMGTSRTEPRYQAGFVAYHQQKGTTDPEVLGRAQLFDDLFEEMMKAVKLVDSKLGPKFLVNKQVTCEVLFLPFATETPEGKLKFVGIHYDKLPEGVQLALVPFRVVDADTGEDLPDSNEFIKQLLSVGRASSVMFIDNSLTQKEGLDVTALVPPLENLEQFKAMLADKSPGSLQRKRDVAAALDPVKVALEQAIIKDPNILGKDLLGKDYEGIVINSRLGPIKVTSQEQRDVISAKQDAKKAAWTERPRENSNKTAVVAVGSFIGHKGHEELFNYTINKAKEVGGDPYLFIGNAEGKDDPIPPAVKVQTWHKLYPQYANNISTVQAGGQLIQKIKHELINPLPGKPPRYDNIIIMVGEDRAGMNMPAALMKAVNKFQGYEHVKVSLDVTPRGTGISGTALRNSLKNDTPEKALSTWSNAFDVNKLGVDWIKHLMDITKQGMGIAQQPQQPKAQPVAERLFTALIRPRLSEMVGPTDKVYHSGLEYEEDIVAKARKIAEFLHDMNPGLFSRYGDEFVMNVVEKITKEMSGASITQIASAVIRHLKSSVDEARMSAAVKLQRAFDRERAKSDASRRRGEEVMAQAKADAEKKSKEQGVAEGLPQTLRKVVPGHAKREIDRKMDAGKFGKTDADKDANFQRYKKIQDKLKEQGVAEMDKSQPSHGRDGKISHSTYGSRDRGGSQGQDRTAKAVPAGQAKQDALDILKKQGVAEGLESGAKILYTGKDKGGTVTISYEPDYIPGHSEKYIIRFDGKVKSEMPTLNSAVYGLTHYQFDTFRPNLQPNPKTALGQGAAEGSLNEFAPDGFNGGDDDEGFSPEIAKMAQEDGFTKGAGLADGATLERAMAINHWHSTHGGMYKQYFAKGFKAGRMDKIRHNNKQYNLNLKLMKDGSIRHGEQGVAEGKVGADPYDRGYHDGQRMGSNSYHNPYSRSDEPTEWDEYKSGFNMAQIELQNDLEDNGFSEGVAEGVPIVVMPSPERLKKAEPTKVRYQGDIVPPTKPPSTEKRGVKGRPGQRPMPDHSVEEDKIKGVDGKACWKGKRYAGKVKKADGTYKDKCVPVSEDVENIMDTLINKIIMNEAVQNNKR